MRILKLFFTIFSLLILSGCLQTSSILGPGVTIATKGNAFQAGLQYGANTALKNETGKDVLTHIKDTVDEKYNEKKLHAKLKKLLKNRIETTRKKLLSN